MQIFRCNFISLACVMLAIMLACPSAYGQLNHSELMDEYARQMQLLPPISVTTEFGGQISEDELKDRFEKFLVVPRRKLLALTAEQREQLRKQLKLSAGENALQKFIEDNNKRQLVGFQVQQQTTGVYEFFNGNHKEFRRYSPDGDLLQTFQFGLAQPKLRSSNQNVWVSKEFSEKHDRTFILSESTVALPGMLPVGPFNGSIHRPKVFVQIRSVLGKLS